MSFFRSSSCWICSFWNADPLVLRISLVFSSANFSLGQTRARSSTFLDQVSTSSMLGSNDGTSWVRFEGTKLDSDVSVPSPAGILSSQSSPLVFPWNRALWKSAVLLSVFRLLELWCSATNVKLTVHQLINQEQFHALRNRPFATTVESTSVSSEMSQRERLLTCCYLPEWYPDHCRLLNEPH